MIPLRALFAGSILSSVCLRSVLAISACRPPQPDTTPWLVEGTYIPNTLSFCKTIGYSGCINKPKCNKKLVVEIEELRNVIGNDTAIIIDVRRDEEVDAGIIKARRWLHIPHLEVEDAFKLSEQNFQEKYGGTKPNKNDGIVFHCRSGVRSLVALSAVRKQGYKRAKHYSGGWLEWSAHL